MNQRKLILSFIVILWLGIISYGFSVLLDYEFKVNSKSTAIKSWPDNSQLKQDPRLDTLLIFVHPHCPCSRASMAELDRLLTSFHQKLHTIVIFSKPAGKDDTWLKSDLWTKAQSLPGATIYVDDENKEAKLFMTNTSGEILLFKNNGTLVYHGGITSSRGHEGDSHGKALISNYLKTGHVPGEEGQAFGCSL